MVKKRPQDRPGEDVLPERVNLAQRFLWDRLVEGSGDRIALRTHPALWSYLAVAGLAASYGRRLRDDHGVLPQERVMIALDDTPDFVGAFFGSLALGAVVVMVNPNLDEKAIAALFSYVRPRALVVGESHRSAFERAGAQSSWSTEVLGVKETAVPAGRAPDFEVADTHRDDAAIWLFSGGTTGRPKAVVQSHGSFVNTTELYGIRTLGLGADDITLSVPRLYFGYATGSNLLFPFSVGASAVLFEEHPTVEVLFEQIASHRPTVLVNVPTMVNRMVNHPRVGEQDFTSLRFATSAGEALPIPLYERWKELTGVELLDGLGTAEMWHVFLTNRLGDVHPGTLGKVVDGFEVRVCDDEGRALPEGEVGRLWVRGQSLAKGYWELPDKTAEAFREGWFAAEDLVQRRPDGTFVYCGRGDDAMKVSGKWVVPQEVESCLMRHEAVRECAVVGVVDEAGLTKPHAFVIPASAPEGLEEELRAFTLEHLDPYKHPRRIILVESFPRTHLGKIDRGRLKRGDG